MTGELKKVTNQKDLANQKLGYLYETYHGFVKYFSKNMFQGMTREAFEDKFWARIQKMVNDGKYEYVKDEKSYLNGIMKKVSYELLREKGKQLKTVDISLYSDSLSSVNNDPGDIISKRELAEDIIEYIGTLESPLPMIFNYYFIMGRNSRWIAHKMHINRNTIRGLLRKIRISINERFKGCL